MGNRGCLHDHTGVLGPRRFRHRSWIICALVFRERKRTINTPGHYTELFALDEATMMAAGHRPCAECRLDQHAVGRHRASPFRQPTAHRFWPFWLTFPDCSLPALIASVHELARTKVRASGALGADRTIATEQGERTFAAGDRMMFLRNERSMGVKNGTLGTLERLEGSSLTPPSLMPEPRPRH
jgi:hypothetical protein